MKNSKFQGLAHVQLEAVLPSGHPPHTPSPGAQSRSAQILSLRVATLPQPSGIRDPPRRCAEKRRRSPSAEPVVQRERGCGGSPGSFTPGSRLPARAARRPSSQPRQPPNGLGGVGQRHRKRPLAQQPPARDENPGSRASLAGAAQLPRRGELCARGRSPRHPRGARGAEGERKYAANREIIAASQRERGRPGRERDGPRSRACIYTRTLVRIDSPSLSRGYVRARVEVPAAAASSPSNLRECKVRRERALTRIFSYAEEREEMLRAAGRRALDREPMPFCSPRPFLPPRSRCVSGL